MLSFLQLRKHQYSEIILIPNKGIGETESTGLSLKYDFAYEMDQNDKSRLMVRFKVNFDDPKENDQKKSLYRGSVEVLGFFEILDKNLNPEDDIVFISAGSILYGVVREMVASLTSRSIHGVIELPILNSKCFAPKSNP